LEVFVGEAMIAPLQIATPRLLLRQWRKSDRAAFAGLNADPEVMRFFPQSLSRAASDAMAERIEQRIDELGWGLWAVEVPGVAEFIGFVGLNSPAPELPCAPCVEIGWRLARAHWRQGYASEAARAALHAAFTRLDFPEIVSFTALGNLPSRAVMASIGMREDPTAAFEHPAIAAGHPLRAHCLYRLDRSDWKVGDGVGRIERR
jgi:RimJ/RimL family protein N-acetyltransferase